MSVDLIVWAVIVLAGSAIGWWLFHQGEKSAAADTMQQVNDDAYKATQIRQDVARMAPDAVRDALRDRLHKSG